MRALRTLKIVKFVRFVHAELLLGRNLEVSLSPLLAAGGDAARRVGIQHRGAPFQIACTSGESSYKHCTQAEVDEQRLAGRAAATGD